MRYKIVTENDIKYIMSRKSFQHNMVRKVIIVGGSFLYHAPPLLSSLAALRTGLRALYLAIPKPLVIPARSVLLDAVIIPLPDLKITKGVVNKILKLIERRKILVNAALIGPGLTGIKKEIGILAYKLVNMNINVVLYSGALYPEVIKYLKGSGSVIITNGGSFFRIFKDKLSGELRDKIKVVSQNADEYGLTILQRDEAADIVSDGTSTYVNYTGSAKFSINGIDDILGGLTVGILSRGIGASQAAVAAAYISSKCSENTFVKYGLHFTASDLINEIPIVMKEYDRVT